MDRALRERTNCSQCYLYQQKIRALQKKVYDLEQQLYATSSSEDQLPISVESDDQMNQTPDQDQDQDKPPPEKCYWSGGCG